MIKHFGTFGKKYAVLISFKFSKKFKDVAIVHLEDHNKLVKFMFDFKRARRSVSEDFANLNSSSITGEPYPPYSLRWFAAHSVEITIFDMSTNPPHHYSKISYSAPYLDYIQFKDVYDRTHPRA